MKNQLAVSSDSLRQLLGPIRVTMRGGYDVPMAIAQRELTLEQFLHLPERSPALEYEDGELRQKVSPKVAHSILQGWICGLFTRAAGPDRRIVAMTELRVTFSRRSVVPDVAVLRRDRMSLRPDGKPEDDVFIPPDVAVEILSPKQSVPRAVERCVWYTRHDVRAALLVDPKDEIVMLFRPGAPLTVLRGGDAIELSDVLPGFSVTADELFSALQLR